MLISEKSGGQSPWLPPPDFEALVYVIAKAYLQVEFALTAA